MNFREYVRTPINEGFFTKLKNKLKFAGVEIGKEDGAEKHYYQYEGGALTARITILKVDKSEDILIFELDDIKSGKKTKVKTTISKWQENNHKNNELGQITGGWLEYSDDAQSRAFKFIQSVYQKNTSIVIKAKTKYILNDEQKITGEDTTFNIAKSKFNKNIDLVDYQGRTTDGDKIAFDPTNIKAGKLKR
jgi:hypothetical protein